MKTLLLFLFLLPLALQTSAKCGSRGITVYPQSHYLPPNGRIVLELFGESAKMLPELGKKHLAYLLEASGEKIPLKVVRTFEGGFRLTQVVLQPSTPLKPGHSYELKVSSLAPYETIHGVYEEGKGTCDKAFWTVKSAATRDTTAPEWISVPVYHSSEHAELGCGPVRFARFRAAATDNSGEIMILATLRQKSTGKTTAFLLPLQLGALLAVGHGMCSGGFYFDADGVYEIIFCPVDFAGNPGTPSYPIHFQRPIMPKS